MSKLLIALTLGAALAGALRLRHAGAARRPLRELGHVTLPKRLDAYSPDEREAFALFPFDRTSGSFLHMGSNRPVAEKLVVAAWTPASREAAREAAVDHARDRTSDIVWRQDGDVAVGEGAHSVNLAEHAAWVLARDDAARGITVAYMVWKRDATLAEARRTLDAALRSFEPGLPPAEYLAVARERPAREQAARLAAIEAALAARGVRVTLDGPPVERDGRWYDLHTDPRDGVIFTVLHPLGTLPVAAAYRDVSPPPPRQLEWTYVSWFAPSVADTAHAAPRGGLYVRDALAHAVNARAAALDAGGPPRAHFYAGAMALLDGSGGQDIDLARVERTAARMAELFAAGRFIAAAR